MTYVENRANPFIDARRGIFEINSRRESPEYLR